MLRISASFLFLTFLTLSVGCGSVSNSPSPTPTPIASPTPTPTPTPSATSDKFLSTVFLEVGRFPAAVGTVTVDTASNNGAGNVQFKGIGLANTTLILQFCSYAQVDINLTNCTNITSLAVDANGDGSTNFTFPLKGTFSGIFQLLQTNDAQLAVTATDTIGTSFHSALLPAATVTGGIQQTTGHAPGSGVIVMNGTDATIALNGTTPNHAFNTAVCNLFLTGPTPQCIALANIMTDVNGNATADIGAVQRDGFSIFRVSDADGVEFVTAFRVQ
jgi:hypothetical protein